MTSPPRPPPACRAEPDLRGSRRPAASARRGAGGRPTFADEDGGAELNHHGEIRARPHHGCRRCVQLQFLPDWSGAHRLSRGAQLPVAPEGWGQPDLARWPGTEHWRQGGQTAATAGDRSSAATAGRSVCSVSHQPDALQPVQAGGAVDTAGRVQVAEEALSTQLPDLRGSLLASRHHRSGSAQTEWREAGKDGYPAGDTQTGGSTAGSPVTGPGGGAQSAASQPSFLWKPIVAHLSIWQPSPLLAQWIPDSCSRT